MFYRLGRGLCILLTYLFFRVRIEGRENVPREGGFVLAANHRTNFDPLFVVNGVHPQIHFMAKAELFEKNKLLGWALRNLGAFPVERGKGDSGALEWAAHVIQSGGVLGMFPEGTRSHTGEPGRPKSGTAMLAQQTGAGVLPCAVCFGQKLGFRSVVVIRYGEMIKNADLGFSGVENSPRELKAASRLIMDGIVRLLEVTE